MTLPLRLWRNSPQQLLLLCFQSHNCSFKEWLWGTPCPVPLLPAAADLHAGGVPMVSIRNSSSFKQDLIQRAGYQGTGEAGRATEGQESNQCSLKAGASTVGLKGRRVSGPTKVHLCSCCTEQNGCPASHPLLPLEAFYWQDLTDFNWQGSCTRQKGRCGGAAVICSAGMWHRGLTLSRCYCADMALHKEC